MVTISRSALVEYSAQQMFDLINDVESYPEFMTGCLAAELIEKTDVILEARLTACKVSLELEFEFANPIVAMTVGKWFEETAGQQVDALCDRASVVYS